MEVEPGQTETPNKTQPEISFEEPLQRVSAPRSEQQPPIDTNPIDVQGDDVAPGYFDEGIASYISEWGAELGDDDQERSIDRAHRMWWNSKLERGRFHNAMKAARHATLTRMSAGRVGSRPMAYFFGVLAGAAADQCVTAGLPLPRGWELTNNNDEDDTKLRRVTRRA